MGILGDELALLVLREVSHGEAGLGLCGLPAKTGAWPKPKAKMAPEVVVVVVVAEVVVVVVVVGARGTGTTATLRTGPTTINIRP